VKVFLEAFGGGQQVQYPQAFLVVYIVVAAIALEAFLDPVPLGGIIDVAGLYITSDLARFHSLRQHFEVARDLLLEGGRGVEFPLLPDPAHHAHLEGISVEFPAPAGDVNLEHPRASGEIGRAHV